MRIMAKLHVIQTTQIHNAPDDLGPEYWFWKQGEAARLYMDSKDNRVHIWSALDYKIPLTDNLVTYVSNTLATHRKSNLDDLGRAIHLLQGFMLYGEHSMPRCKFIITLPDDNIHSDGDKNREQVIAALKAACDKMAEWGYANDAPEEWWLHEEE